MIGFVSSRVRCEVQTRQFHSWTWYGVVSIQCVVKVELGPEVCEGGGELGHDYVVQLFKIALEIHTCRVNYRLGKISL